MSSASQIMAGILLITVLAVEFGGLSLLAMLTRRIPGYLDNPLRQNMFRPGHPTPGGGACSAPSRFRGWNRPAFADRWSGLSGRPLRWDRFRFRSGSFRPSTGPRQ